MRISDWSSDVCSSDLQQIGESKRVFSEYFKVFSGVKAKPHRSADTCTVEVIHVQFLFSFGIDINAKHGTFSIKFILSSHQVRKAGPGHNVESGYNIKL